jgi:transcriptional regulator with XRE-family HTH domain
MSKTRSRLQKLRKGHKLTQEALAERTGVRQNTISDLEKGRATDPRLSTAWRLSRALGADVQTVFPEACK